MSKMKKPMTRSIRRDSTIEFPRPPIPRAMHVMITVQRTNPKMATVGPIFFAPLFAPVALRSLPPNNVQAKVATMVEISAARIFYAFNLAATVPATRVIPTVKRSQHA